MEMNEDELNLTNWLEEVQVRPEKVKQKHPYEDLPLIPALIPSLLTRAKLSEETRLLEEQRLAKLARKKRTLRNSKKVKKPSKGRYHWKRKEANRKKALRKRYEQYAGYWAFKDMATRRGWRKATWEQWERLIVPLFREYSPEYLSWKITKRVPKTIAGVRGKWYGSKEYPHTVYSIKVVHSLLGVVYDGHEQREKDKAAGLLPAAELAKEKPAPEGLA